MTYAGILPDIDEPLTAPFWAAAREGRLVAQRCTRCRSFRWTPGELCPECLSTEAEWAGLGGRATVWSFAVYHRAMHPAFTGAVPYTVAMLELPEGIQMLGMVHTATRGGDGELRIGDEVEAVFDAVADDVTLVRWRVIGSAAQETETTR